MLSIRSATNELDRLEDLLRVAADVHAQGIRSAADYVVEIEPGSAREFREHLRALQRQVIAAGTAED